MALEEADLLVLLAQIVPTVFQTGVVPLVGGAASAGDAEGEAPSEAVMEAEDPLLTIKVPLKATWGATMITIQGQRKTHTIRMAITMRECLSSMGHQTLLVHTTKASEILKVR